MENKLVKITADMFIIPNHSCKSDDFIVNYDEILRSAGNILNFIGKNLSDDEDYIETWMVSNEVGCDNISDHGFVFTIDGQGYYVKAGTISRFIPKSAISIKEGEKSMLMYRNIKAIPVNTHEDISFARTGIKSDYVNVDLLIEATANQHDYRYREFGTFEKVLNRVCR